MVLPFACEKEKNQNNAYGSVRRDSKQAEYLADK